MSELVHAIAIMAHYHSLAGFCLGCGVNPEIDTPIGHTYNGKKGENSSTTTQSMYTNPALGIGRRTPSDSESETLSPTAHSPPALDGSPTQRNMTKSIVQHFIQSKSNTLHAKLKYYTQSCCYSLLFGHLRCGLSTGNYFNINSITIDNNKCTCNSKLLFFPSTCTCNIYK